MAPQSRRERESSSPEVGTQILTWKFDLLPTLNLCVLFLVCSCIYFKAWKQSGFFRLVFIVIQNDLTKNCWYISKACDLNLQRLEYKVRYSTTLRLVSCLLIFPSQWTVVENKNRVGFRDFILLGRFWAKWTFYRSPISILLFEAYFDAFLWQPREWWIESCGPFSKIGEACSFFPRQWSPQTCCFAPISFSKNIFGSDVVRSLTALWCDSIWLMGF